MRKIKTLNILFLLALTTLFSAQAIAKGPVYTSFTGKAIKGYDVVAYFTENKPVKGSKEFSYEWNSATWLFSSSENLAKFKAAPENFAPQYGGYCAYAVSQGYTASVDPTQFTVLDGKLYLNYNKSVNKKWTANRDAFIVDANNNWPGILAGLK